jgi:hypothetical protein
VQPVEPVTGCDPCDNGCHCDGSAERPGCEHWGCWGPAAITATLTPCPIGTDAHRAHMNATIQYRRDLHAYNQASHRR